jgi:hypothetical protein
VIHERYSPVRRSCGPYRDARQAVKATGAESMKPFLSVKTDINILGGQPFNKGSVRPGRVRRKSTGIALADPCWLLPIFLMFYGNHLFGTTVLAIRTPTVLVVGADSFVRRGDGIPLDMVCKIRKYGRFYASFAGMSNDEDTGFNVYTIATNAMTKCGTIECAVSNFIREVRVPLIDTLVVAKKRDGEVYFTENFLKRSPLQVLFYGQQGNSTIVRMVVFNVDKTKLRVDLTVDDDGGCPGTCGPQGIAFNGIGSYFLAADLFRSALESRFIANSPVRVISQALAAEAEANQKAVSAPFSIVVMDGTSIRWQDGYQGACPDIGR